MMAKPIKTFELHYPVIQFLTVIYKIYAWKYHLCLKSVHKINIMLPRDKPSIILSQKHKGPKSIQDNIICLETNSCVTLTPCVARVNNWHVIWDFVFWAFDFCSVILSRSGCKHLFAYCHCEEKNTYKFEPFQLLHCLLFYDCYCQPIKT